MRRLMLLRHAQDRARRTFRPRSGPAIGPAWPGRRGRNRRLDRPASAFSRSGAGFARSARGAKPGKSPGRRLKDLAPEPQVELAPELYGADPSQLLQTIREASATDPKRLLLVGHNPGMHELALALAGSGDAAGRKALADNLPTSGLAVFDFAADHWTDVAFRRGRLALFVTPRLLKQTSGD